MQNLRRLIRQIIKESLLVEATCPGCGSPNAYVGLSAIECDKRSCKYFSPRQAADMRKPLNKTPFAPSTKYERPWMNSRGEFIHHQRSFMHPRDAHELAKKLGLSDEAAKYIKDEFARATDSIESYSTDAGAAVGGSGRINTHAAGDWSQDERSFHDNATKYPWGLYAPNPDAEELDDEKLTADDIADIEAVAEHFFENTPTGYDPEEWLKKVEDYANGGNPDPDDDDDDDDDACPDCGTPGSGALPEECENCSPEAYAERFGDTDDPIDDDDDYLRSEEEEEEDDDPNRPFNT